MSAGRNREAGFFTRSINRPCGRALGALIRRDPGIVSHCIRIVHVVTLETRSTRYCMCIVHRENDDISGVVAVRTTEPEPRSDNFLIIRSCCHSRKSRKRDEWKVWLCFITPELRRKPCPDTRIMRVTSTRKRRKWRLDEEKACPVCDPSMLNNIFNVLRKSYHFTLLHNVKIGRKDSFIVNEHRALYLDGFT